VTAQLSQRHPSRSVLFLRSEAEPDGLAAEVSAFCTLQPGAQRQICCEQLRIEGRGSYAKQLHSIVQPLLVRDVPTFVWWRGAPPLRTAMYRRLRQMSQRIVVDSSGFREAFAELAAEVAHSTAEHCAISDLGWGRLEGWREQLARLFDPPDTRGYLSHISAVRIVSADSAYPTEAVLLLGWLASRLDWQVESRLESGDAWTCSFRRGDKQIRCTVVTSKGQGSIEPITSVSLAAGDGEFELSVTAQGSVTQRIRLGGKTLLSTSSGMRAPDLASLLSQELELTVNDHVYESAVAIGATLSGAWNRADCPRGPRGACR
jgi:glucose-6-phosphate dehydrogenase assembly protein OpcA